MTRDDIIRIAREAKLSNEIGAFGYPYLPELERFAAIVAAAEREACAKVCDEYAKYSSNPMNFSENCAETIRARGESK